MMRSGDAKRLTFPCFSRKDGRLMTPMRTLTHLIACAGILFLASCNPGGDLNNNANNQNNGNNENNVNNENDAGDDAGPVVLEDPVKVMTWNVQRYFDTQCDSFCDDDSFEEVLAPAIFEFRATQIADAIRDADADIILFQELEKEVCLDEIASNLEMQGTAFGETFFGGSLDVGVATRGSITEVVLHRDATDLQLSGGGTDKFTREFLEVHIDLDGREVIVFNAHFKAKRNDDPELREAEARAASEIVAAVADENPDALVVLGGDINDTPDSPPMDELTENLELVSGETFTYFFGELQAIDHLLYAPNGAGGLVEDSVETITDRGADGAGLSISDHSALVATFGFIP